MKFLEMLSRQKQSKFYAIRGRNWHIAVAYFLVNGVLVQKTFVHVFDNIPQDSVTTAAVIENTLKKLESVKPELDTAFIKADNAGCYHSNIMVAAICEVNSSTTKQIKIKRVDFSDPQAGKAQPDRKAGLYKATFKRLVNR